MTIGGYYIMAINNYFIDGYWWIFYRWLLVDILSMDIGGYSRLNYHKLLVVINCYYVSGYLWLFY